MPIRESPWLGKDTLGRWYKCEFCFCRWLAEEERDPYPTDLRALTILHTCRVLFARLPDESQLRYKA